MDTISAGDLHTAMEYANEEDHYGDGTYAMLIRGPYPHQPTEFIISPVKHTAGRVDSVCLHKLVLDCMIIWRWWKSNS